MVWKEKLGIAEDNFSKKDIFLLGNWQNACLTIS